ncbi:MAG: mechanosensitive ion channel [Candidatus Latescibacterota bacterium]
MQDILNHITQSVGAYIPNLIGALVILIIGWVIALAVSGVVRNGIRRTKLDSRLASRFFGAEEGAKAPDIARGVGKGVFWVIMFLVLVAFFQVLGLTLATDPINPLLNQVFESIPKLFGAGILLLIAWIIASVLRLMISRALRAAKFDERIGSQVTPEKEKPVPLTKTIADAVYWVIFLLFLPAVLDALGLEGLLEPVQSMLDKSLGFLPNILAAVFIGIIGWCAARIVQRMVTNLLADTGLDRISKRAGVAPLSGTMGLVVYILILISVLIGALNALKLEAITQPTSRMLNVILEALPAIFASGVVVTIAYVVGKVVSRLITDLLTRIGFNTILIRLGIGKEPKEGEHTPSEAMGYIAWVAILLLATFEASSMLGFEALSELMASLTVFGAHILLGITIMGIGLYLANLVSKAVQAGGTAQASLFALVARVAILLLVGSIALSQMGLANEIINLAFGLLLGAIAVAVGIAFGIGGRDVAARKLAEWTKSPKSE